MSTPELKAIDTKDNTDARYDLPEFTGTPSFLFICSSPRCGSTFLSAYLREIGLAGYPIEYFNPQKMVKLADRWKVCPNDGI